MTAYGAITQRLLEFTRTVACRQLPMGLSR